MNKQINDFTVEELKAMGFDLVKQFEVVQNNLKIINEELARREKVEQEKVIETQNAVKKESKQKGV